MICPAFAIAGGPVTRHDRTATVHRPFGNRACFHLVLATDKCLCCNLWCCTICVSLDSFDVLLYQSYESDVQYFGINDKYFVNRDLQEVAVSPRGVEVN